MTKQQPDNRPNQKGNFGRDGMMVGGDIHGNVGGNQTNSHNFNLLIPLLFLGVLGLGSLAWAVNTGLLNGSGNPQQISTPAPSQTKGNTNP